MKPIYFIAYGYKTSRQEDSKQIVHRKMNSLVLFFIEIKEIYGLKHEVFR